MAAVDNAPMVSPVPAQPPLVPPKTTTTPSMASTRTPFSAVAPPRFLPLEEMAAVDIAPMVSPVPAQQPLVPPKTTTTPSMASTRTPFSAVAPPRFFSLSRLQIHITLETIYEEETSEEFTETSDSSSASFLSKNQTCCFLEVPTPWSSYDNNCQCA